MTHLSGHDQVHGSGATRADAGRGDVARRDRASTGTPRIDGGVLGGAPRASRGERGAARAAGTPGAEGVGSVGRRRALDRADRRESRSEQADRKTLAADIRTQDPAPTRPGRSGEGGSLSWLAQGGDDVRHARVDRVRPRGTWLPPLCALPCAARERRRRRIKETLVAEAGGECVLCGYSRCLAALQFHHVDPVNKRFHLSMHGVSRSIARAREEAAKCVLLCANCHAEVEQGLSVVSSGK